MAEYTREVATDIVFPNITVYRTLRDGELTMYDVYSNDGYVMYDTTANDTEPKEDPETGDMIEVPVTYYFTWITYPKTYNFTNFHWIAVPRDSVDENYILGGDNDHEVM